MGSHDCILHVPCIYPALEVIYELPYMRGLGSTLWTIFERILLCYWGWCVLCVRVLLRIWITFYGIANLHIQFEKVLFWRPRVCVWLVIVSGSWWTFYFTHEFQDKRDILVCSCGIYDLRGLEEILEVLSALGRKERGLV